MGGTPRWTRIAIGESALTVMAAAAHRGRAFDACELVADRVKARVPIWKEQELLDGSIRWVNGYFVRLAF